MSELKRVVFPALGLPTIAMKGERTVDELTALIYGLNFEASGLVLSETEAISPHVYFNWIAKWGHLDYIENGSNRKAHFLESNRVRTIAGDPRNSG